jgi:predicted nucleic acid-binding protein
MMKLFLDTGYLIALEAADDQYHKAALAHWQGITKSLPLLVTTSYIFNEVVTFFNSRSRHAKSVEIGSLLLESPSVKLVHVDQPLFLEGWRYFVRHSDKSYSFTDCVSFVVMRRLRIRTALTFDKHFSQAGFVQQPPSESRVLI